MFSRLSLWLCLFVFSLSSLACRPQPYVYQAPPSKPDGINIVDAKKRGFSIAPLKAMVDGIRQGTHPGVHSVLLLHKGALLLEEYFDGYTRDTLHDLRSTTKSITSLLTGIAIAEGKLKGVTQRVWPLLAPQEQVTGFKAQLALQDLLTMRTGLACNDWDPNSPGQEDKMYNTRSWIKHVMQLPAKEAPGQNYAYCTGGVILIGAMIAKATGRSIPDFAQRKLFGPLGIRKRRWSKMPDGGTDTGGHLWLTPRAMAKIGQLVLQQGNWQGKQLVPRAWLQRSTKAHVTTRQFQYGYLWWLGRGRNQKTGQMIDIIHSSGNGGQLIIVIPQFDLVAVFTGGNYNSPLTRQPLQLLAKYIIPSYKPLMRR